MESNQEQFDKANLILRHLRGELSPQEEKELELWLSSGEGNRRLFEKIKGEHEQALAFFSSLDTDAAWQRVASQTVAQEEQTRSLWRHTALWKYAAVITLILATSLVVYQTQVRKHSQLAGTARIAPEQQAEEILPGGDKAMLTFSDGSFFVLEELDNGTVREEKGVRVSKKDGLVSFEIADNRSEQVFFNTISTPVGGQYQVVLPDGSKVWLNSASSLHFPSAFVARERVVELTGEGYFEIAKNQQKPFIVKVNSATVEVLGTHFNVMSYANEGRITTTLLEGSVKVGNGNATKVLVPGQQASIGKDILLKEVDVDEAVAWKNGLFYFNNADIGTVMRQLERWYGIEASYSGEVPTKHFSGIISRDTEIDKVLEMLALTRAIEFRTEGRKIIVSSQ
ncbi:FecR family protein [Pontibacter kalidii]|uniref:FecR family protein n=1 Tax=Pontibacter kalidii TaxID=2592049 RepID=UPI0022532C61|nr:FecR domain-containing protein [Pontibacter kalidii]